MKILMIEDDKATVEVIRLTLEVQDPETTLKSTIKGRDGLESARKERFDVVLLDLGLPDIDGINVLKELRGFSQIPVLIVSARHDPEVITNALNLGAQDYILKPFNFHALLNRLRDVTAQPATSKNGEKCGHFNADLTISKTNHEVNVKGQQVELTADEWRVLNNLIEYHGRIVPVKVLAETLSESGFAGESAIDMTINQLRKKLGDDLYSPRIIISEYGCGYRFMKPNIEQPSERKDALD
jgi:two-component system, OmpR family, KDP operon response regulator KdpE